MNDNAKKWVQALRSGEFHQTQGALTRVAADGTTSHCCLGVACVLAEREGIVAATKFHDTVEGQDLVSYINSAVDPALGIPGESLYLPEVVEAWLGLRDHQGSFNDYDQRGSLAKQNDRGASFEEIARIIETTPEVFA